MKTFVYREVRKPNLERRRELLSQLAIINKYPDMKDIKRELRQELRKTEGHTFYYLFYKGLRYFLGDASLSGKFILMNLNEDVIKKELQNIRFNRKLEQTKNIYIKSVDQYISVPTINGLPTEKNIYIRANKKVRSFKALRSKKPSTNDSYVGIELEFASILDLDQIADKIAEANLHDTVRVMRDGSIVTEGPYVNQVEFCILSKFSDLDKTLEKFKIILNPDEFLANDSCGLHVHLDARNGDVKKMFHNLVCMQTLLFDMVAEHRAESKYCNPLSTPEFDLIDYTAPHAHWDAISKYAFYKHRTIEIRMHESTTDLTNVSKWVKLLKKIADYKGEPLKFGIGKKQIDKIQLEPDLMKYIESKQAV